MGSGEDKPDEVSTSPTSEDMSETKLSSAPETDMSGKVQKVAGTETVLSEGQTMTTHPLQPTPRSRRSHLDYVHTKTFTPREYQVELLDSAREHNVISCMGTGAGKTFIAVMLIRELSHELRGNYEENAKRTIFLCSTVAQVRQHRHTLEDHTDLIVKQYEGLAGVHYWLQDDWLEEFRNNQVLVMTPDIFKGILSSGFMPLWKVNLLILDECHHALKNHPYKEIMKLYDACPAAKRPKILGLSTSLLSSSCKPEELEQKIRNLEKGLRSGVETASELSSVHLHVTKPREDRCIFMPYSCCSEIFNSIKDKLECGLEFLCDVVLELEPDDDLPDALIQPKRYLMEVSHILLSLGPWCMLRAAKVFMREISRMVENAYSPPHIQLLMLVRTVLEIVVVLCEKIMEGHDNQSRLLNFAPNKLKCLLNILKEFKPEETPCVVPDDSNVQIKPAEKRRQYNHIEESKCLSGIIFVKQRVTAFVLNAWLQEVAKTESDFSFLSSNYVVGHSAVSRSRGIAMSPQHQEDTLRKFRMREHNLIVATSVVEEGMDVPRCNLVVRFDLPSDFRAYIQSKGRARAPGSVFVLMVASDQQDKALEQLINYHTIEKILGRQIGFRGLPTEESIDEQEANQLLEPYMPVKEDGTPKVTMSSAIALVNRYCGKLPSDTFTRLTPKWNVERLEDGVETKFKCSLTLPINSPLKEAITGPPMSSKRLSQMATALKVCECLHKIGELDDNLLPVGKESVRIQEDPSLHNEEVPPGAPRPGTTKRRQYYYKMVAEVLQGSGPVTAIPCFLYRFSMTLTCPIPQEQNTRGRKIHDPADTSRGFGILTSKPIPPICCFPVFTRSGEVTIKLECIATDIVYSKEQLKLLLDFHRYSFSDVLRLEKYPMIFDSQESDSAYYVVPINQGPTDAWDVDWDFVHSISTQSQKITRKISEDERKSYTFRTEDYTDAVVMPWYRNVDKPQFFYVAEICSELSPLSDFPDAGHKTFEGYYQEKYSINIMNKKQPLLDVDHTSARLNLLTPRYVNRKGMTLPTSSEQTKKAKRENLQQKQILVPELCIVHPFPASLWRKAVCLPCILYRINSLLLSEQLRVTVAKEIGIGTILLPPDFKWPALDFGWTLAEVLEKAAQQASKEDKIKPAAVTFKPPKVEGLKPIPNTWNDAPVNEDSSDFVIDTFDPTKVHIPDDDFLLDQEVAHLTFGGGPIWTAPSMDPPLPEGTVRIRYGSPSRFEGTGWDSEWDTDLEETTTYQLNIPGLGYISAPSGFNIQGLSHDLASCRDDDIWDSDFDDDSVYDEMEGLPDSPIPPSIPEAEVEENSDDAQAENKGIKIATKESLMSEWLSQCSSDLAIQKTSPEDQNLLINGRIDECVKKDVSALVELAKQTIFLKKDLCELASSEDQSKTYPRLAEAVSFIEKNSSPEISTTVNVEESQLNNDDIFSSQEDLVNSMPAADFETTPTFGELLPGREKVKSEDFAIFRVHFDDQPNLLEHEGPSLSIILQAFTMSNANDGINLERLETVGDSFLKYAITAYLYCSHPDIHEGKLSYLRSKQISNLHLYRLGKRCGLGKLMIASKFEPNDNWLPPCYTVPKGLEQAFIDSGMPAGHWNIGNMRDLRGLTEEEIRQVILEEKKSMSVKKPFINGPELFDTLPTLDPDGTPYIRYNLLTQQSIPDKSIADCVESLIGAYLISCGPRGALLFMSWLGLRVLPEISKSSEDQKSSYSNVLPPKSPLLHHVSDPYKELDLLLTGYNQFENKIGYTFRDRSYLLQAFTHASYHYNRLTDCYQRLEFLGDAVLDYLITRHLYEDPQQHYPGVLTDLRSALVNNTFFASLAVKYEFHKYFKAVSPGLFSVIGKFVDIKKKNPDFIHLEEYYLEEDECEEAEEVEVPKALGDIFESVAGAIYLDSGMSLDTVWRVYFAMMKPEIEYFSTHVPKSPIRELLETYPQTARFDRAEMTLSGKVRVRVEVVGQGQFVGLGRNKRIAKCTAAKRALRALKKMHRHE